MIKNRTYTVSPPGTTIKEYLLARGITQKEFAVRMDMSEKHISKLINGEVHLTPDVAVRLETVLDTSAGFWNKLEAVYQEKRIKENIDPEMAEDITFMENLPYQEMADLGWIPRTEDSCQQVRYLRKYFEVVNLRMITNRQLFRLACPPVEVYDRQVLAFLAWVQRVRMEARSVKTDPLDLKRLSAKLSEIRRMTNLSFSEFRPQLFTLLSCCGIAVIFLDPIKDTTPDHVSFMDGRKIVIGIRIPDKEPYSFWHSFAHELGHILLGHINQINGTCQEDETAADQFAQDFLSNSSEN